MDKKELLNKAREKRTKPQIVFSCPAYAIRIIPLNYEVVVKLPRNSRFLSIGKRFYCDVELGIGHAHELARTMISRYFQG